MNYRFWLRILFWSNTWWLAKHVDHFDTHAGVISPANWSTVSNVFHLKINIEVFNVVIPLCYFCQFRLISSDFFILLKCEKTGLN